MIYPKIFLIFIVLSFCQLNAAFLSVFSEPRSIAKGGIASSTDISCFAPFNKSQTTNFSLDYNLPYGLAELARQKINAAIPVFTRSMVVSIENFGNETYRENSLFIAFPLFQSDKIFFVPTARFNYLNSTEKSYYATGAGLAFLFIPIQEFEIITTADNALSTTLNRENVESGYHLSLSYQPDRDLKLFLGLDKDRNNSAVVKTGLEICMLDKIHLQAGYNFEPALYTTGFDFDLGNWNFAYAFTYHDQLGFSQLAGVSFRSK